MNQSQDYGQMDFNLPHDVVPLPSKGLFYKNKKKSIKVGYLTAQDENLLMSNNMNNENIINQLLRTKIFEPDLKIDDLLPGDVEAILLFLRNTAFGTKYDVSTFDSKSGERFQTSIDLSELNIKNTDELPNSNGFFTTTLPVNGDSVELRLLTFGEENQIEKEMSLYPKTVVAPTVTKKLESHIVSINGNNDRNYITTYIASMPIADSKHIRKYLRTVEPKLDLTKKVTTPSGDEVDVTVTFGVEFFRPFFGL
jgi:hypothetical protein